MAKLLKENKTLKKYYKDLYDFIKVTRTKTIKQTTSLIAKNDEFKAQLQEKGFTIAASKNELRKLTGNSMNTKFAKPSILGKPVLQPLRNQSVVRQLTAFKSERPNFSKPWFASQVDVNNVLNSSRESYRSNDMAHNYYLEEAKKKSRDKNTNLKPSVMHTTSLQNTTNGSKPKPRSNNQTSRSLHVAKSSHEMLNGVTLVDHSRNSSFFSDSKHFVCSTCQKCVFIANHDDCITKFLKEVNSRAKVQSLKSRNNMKPAKRIHERWISKGYRFSPNKSSAVHEKPNTPRSCLRWKPTGIIFKIVGLRWIPTRKMFTDNTAKVDSEPLNGSNDDITNPYECDQTLNVSAGTLKLSAGLTLHRQMVYADNTSSPAPQRKERTRVKYSISNIRCPTNKRMTGIHFFKSMFDEYFKPPSNVDHPVPEVPTPVPAASTCSRSSTTVDQDASSSSTSQTTLDEQSSAIPQGVEDDFYDIEVAHMDTDPYFGIPIPKPNSEETILQGVIPSNVHHLNQSFDTLTKLTKNHPLDNVTGDPSRPVLTRSQLQGHAIWCYFDANDNPIPLVGNGVVEIYYLKGRIMVNQRDLPRDNSLVSVEVLRHDKRSKSENKGKVSTEMELVLEQTQQGSSHEVSVSTEGVEELKRNVRINGEKKEALHIFRTSERYVCIHNEDGNPVRANIKQALGRYKRRCCSLIPAESDSLPHAHT
ncbi:hypothetical protein Tco_1255547 [Tanacetum coccineum]